MYRKSHPPGGGDGVGGMAGWAFIFGGMAGSEFFFGGMAGLELLAGCDISNFIWRDGGISPFWTHQLWRLVL